MSWKVGLGILALLWLIAMARSDVPDDPVGDCMSDNAQYVDGWVVSPQEYADLESACYDLYGGR